MSINIGEKLKRARQSMGLSIEDIRRYTRIDTKYLIAIEKGEFNRLPSLIYVRSYLRSYANVVGEDPQPLLRSISEESISSMTKQKSSTYRRVQSNPFSNSLQKNLLAAPRHRITLEEEGSQVRVSQFVPRKVTGMSQRNSNQEKGRFLKQDELSSQSLIAVSSESVIFSDKIKLPANLPKPEELRIPTDGKEITEINDLLPKRSTVFKKRSPRGGTSYGRLYTWVLIVSAVLLMIAVIISVFSANATVQNTDKIRVNLQNYKQAQTQADSKKPILRELQIGVNPLWYGVDSR